ncbi:hypothetical protein ACGFZJ_29490 [Streptomyces sp. NPDC048253]|uniref:hypothetical protein n=1 Tax=Streptomyces sp. NPDC048253 TaxID=3365524 RepID=UPI0037196825
MDDLDLSLYESVGRRLAWGVIDRCITSGQIDIEGMTDEDVVNTVLFDFLNEPEPCDSTSEQESSSPDEELYWVTDHSDALLRKASEAMDT